MTDHADARRLASAAVEGTLTADEERELALHIVRCQDCKTFYDGLATATHALRRMAPDDPPSEAVDAAVRRSTTVLRGDADPGPVARGPSTAPPATPTTPDAPEAPSEPLVERDTRPILPPDVAPAPTFSRPPRLEDLPPVGGSSAAPAPPPPVPAPPPVEPEPERTAPTPLEPEPPAPGPPDVVAADPPVLEAEPLDTGPLAPPREPSQPREPKGSRSSRGVLIAISATVLVAILAVIVVSRRPGGSGASLPGPDDVRRSVAAAFDDLQSFKTSFSLSRLGLYRVRGSADSVVYSFSNGEHSGRIVFEGPDLLREEVTLVVPDAPERRWTTVRKTEDVRTFVQDGDATPTLTVTANYPLGPPDGPLQQDLGILESALGSATRLIVDAADLEVVDRTTFDDRDAYRVRFSVAPNGFTRADRIEALIDTTTSVPLQVRRSISRADADVLGPPDLLTDETLDAAFGQRDRLTTELVQLSNVVLDDVVLPGEFVLDVPEGVEPTNRDGRYARTSRATLEDDTPFGQMLPTMLPQGFREDAYTLYAGEPGGWGPGGSYPAPSRMMQASYTDGKTTIFLALRTMPDGPFEIDGSPLDGDGLPSTVRSLVRGGRQLSYGVGPDTAPHVFGFVGDVFVLVSGDVPEDDLLRVAASVGTEASAPGPTPTPAS